MKSTKLDSGVPGRQSINVSCFYTVFLGEGDAAADTLLACALEKSCGLLFPTMPSTHFPTTHRHRDPEQATSTRTAHLRMEMGLKRPHLSTLSVLECLSWSHPTYRDPFQWGGIRYLMRQPILPARCLQGLGWHKTLVPLTRPFKLTAQSNSLPSSSPQGSLKWELPRWTTQECMSVNILLKKSIFPHLRCF